MAVDLFDPNFYRFVNPDLSNFSTEQARQHFFSFGIEEGRSFSPFVDLDFYRLANPDLNAVFTNNRDFYTHLSQVGVGEGRDFSHVFDADFYRAGAPDLVAAGLNNEQLIEHFRNFGIDEGRVASSLFDANFYINSSELFGLGFDRRQGLVHFQGFGIEEERASSPQFNLGAYLQLNPDLVAAGIEGDAVLTHYLLFGQQEGRSSTFPVEPGDSLALATDLGILNENDALVFGDALPKDDRDYYKFSVNEAVQISMTNDTDSRPGLDLNLVLGRDSDEDGTIEPLSISEAELFSSSITISGRELNLVPGTYFLELTSPNSADSDYNITIDAVSRPPIAPDTAGNTIATARYLGTISTSQTLSEFVGIVDTEDFYRFSLDTAASISASADSVPLVLFRDRNNNGAIDPEETIQSSNPLDVRLTPDTYFLQVEAPQGLGVELNTQRIFDREYTLTVAPSSDNPDGAGNTVNTARQVDILTGMPVVSDFVGEKDDRDLYRFDLDGNTQVNLNLNLQLANPTPATAGAFAIQEMFDLNLLQDANGNGILEPEEAIASEGAAISRQNPSVGGNLNIDRTLDPGTYFVEVESLDFVIPIISRTGPITIPSEATYDLAF